MSILGFILFIFLFILVFGFSIIVSIVKAIFGIGRSSKRADSTSSNQSRKKEYTTNNDYSEKKKKLFDKDEGEYVDYEEIKDNE